ncbi:MAG TPA: hypothetical protein VFQ83_08855 [Candidatus Udaeobacter sp.]|jgi:hypothetical protein|nr:hypothetical protein [Candidatus Udaeobacter sp.]
MKDEKKRLLVALPFRATASCARVAPLAFALRVALTLVVAATLIGTTQAAVSQVIGPFIAAAGENDAGESVIDLFDEDGDCMEAIVSDVSGTVGCALIDWHGKTEFSEVIVTFSLGATYHIPYGNFVPCSQGSKVVSGRCSKDSPESSRKARRTGPNPSSTPIVVPISNDADSLAVSCDGRFAIVVGSTSQTNTPVSLEDLEAHKEVATVPYPDKLARASAIGDDSQTVLVSLDNSTGGGAPAVRRLTLDEQNGTLTDAGVELAFDSSDFPTRMSIAPGSHVGVTLVRHSQPVTTDLVSFSLPDLTIQDSVTLSGAIGNAVVFSCAGDKIYARSGSQALDPDVIEGFDFDPLTGTINHTAFVTINGISIFYGTGFGDPLAISPDGTLLIAAEENEDGRLPAPRVSVWDAVTGMFVQDFSSTDFAPHLVAAVPCCALGPAPTPSPTPSTTPTATPTPTPCTGRCGPTPRPRPSPHSRPIPP